MSDVSSFGKDLFEHAGFTVAGVKGLDQIGATLAWEAHVVEFYDLPQKPPTSQCLLS
jgi:hypothetical protein